METIKSIEEKAKRYDQALEWMKDVYPTLEGAAKEDAEHFFPELKESEDEKIRKAIIKCLKWLQDEARWTDVYGISFDSIFAWFEKQREHANFINKIQIGDKVTRNEDGVLVNLSQLNRVAKKQGEQNPAWSEEDEKIINKLIAVVELYYGIGDDLDKQRCLSWLNSLKDRYTWKPTKEQLTELRCVISGCSYDIEPLVELEKELKAL